MIPLKAKIAELAARPRVLIAAACVALMAGAGLIVYSALNRPGDVSNPGASFDPDPGAPSAGSDRDWPLYGGNPARTRYLGNTGISPPFKVEWRFDGRKLLEYSPIAVGQTLYGVNNNGQAFAIDADTGKARWRREIAELNASSPAYSRGSLYIATLEPGRVIALDAATGEVRWRRELPGRSESSPVVVGNRIFVGCECGTLYALDTESGKTLWETGLGGQVKAAPAYSKGTLYVGDYGGKMSAVRARDGSIKWQTGSQGSSFGRAGRFYATAAIAFGRVYAGSIDGRMYSFEQATGELAWTHSTGGFVYAGAVVADTPKTGPTVYFGSYDGRFYALDARSGDERWVSPAGGKVSGAASLVDETVYVSSLDHRDTLGFRAADGKQVFRFNDGAYNPAVSDGENLFLTGYKNIYRLREVGRE